MFFTYICVPSIQINNKADALRRKEELLQKTRFQYSTQDESVDAEISEELEKLEEYLDEVRKAYLIFKRNEGCYELVPQQSIQLVMLLLSQTLYPTVHGLEAVFAVDYSDTVEARTPRPRHLCLEDGHQHPVQERTQADKVVARVGVDQRAGHLPGLGRRRGGRGGDREDSRGLSESVVVGSLRDDRDDRAADDLQPPPAWPSLCDK